MIQQVERIQLWHVLKCTPITENLIWFLEIFTGNIEPEQRIKFAPVQMWFAVIWAEWVSRPMHLYISPLIIWVDFPEENDNLLDSEHNKNGPHLLVN